MSASASSRLQLYRTIDGCPNEGEEMVKYHSEKRIYTWRRPSHITSQVEDYAKRMQLNVITFKVDIGSVLTSTEIGMNMTTNVPVRSQMHLIDIPNINS